MESVGKKKLYKGPSLEQLGVNEVKLKKYRVEGPDGACRSSRFPVATKAGARGKDCGQLYNKYFTGVSRGDRLKGVAFLAEMQCQAQYEVSRKFDTVLFDGLLFVDFGLRASIDYDAIPCISYLVVKYIFEADEGTMRHLFITSRARGPLLLGKTLKAMGATKVGAWRDAIGKADVYRVSRQVLEGNGIVVKRSEDWSQLSGN